MQCTARNMQRLCRAFGYQLVSPILAHALYDFEAILFPHLRVTALMAYARDGAGGAGESPLVSRNALRIAAAAGQSADDVLRVRAAYLLVDRTARAASTPTSCGACWPRSASSRPRRRRTPSCASGRVEPRS